MLRLALPYILLILLSCPDFISYTVNPSVYLKSLHLTRWWKYRSMRKIWMRLSFCTLSCQQLYTTFFFFFPPWPHVVLFLEKMVGVYHLNKPTKSKSSFSAEIVKQGPWSCAEEANIVAKEGKKISVNDVIAGIGEEGKLMRRWIDLVFHEHHFPCLYACSDHLQASLNFIRSWCWCVHLSKHVVTVGTRSGSTLCKEKRHLK